MVYYSSSLGKIRFNRNILYCKSSISREVCDVNNNLIETFCIVNKKKSLIVLLIDSNLIETFCIVNVIFNDSITKNNYI